MQGYGLQLTAQSVIVSLLCFKSLTSMRPLSLAGHSHDSRRCNQYAAPGLCAQAACARCCCKDLRCPPCGAAGRMPWTCETSSACTIDISSVRDALCSCTSCGKFLALRYQNWSDLWVCARACELARMHIRKQAWLKVHIS